MRQQFFIEFMNAFRITAMNNWTLERVRLQLHSPFHISTFFVRVKPSVLKGYPSMSKRIFSSIISFKQEKFDVDDQLLLSISASNCF